MASWFFFWILVRGILLGIGCRFLFTRLAVVQGYSVAEKNAIPKGILHEKVEIFWLRCFMMRNCP
jgi:hypothetical protein